MNNLIPSGLATLREAEAMAVEGAAQWISGQNLVAIALHQITSQKLYLAEKDENDLPLYPSFEAYFKGSLEAKMGIGRSEAFNCLRDIRIAMGPSFNLNYETFARLGGTARFRAVPEVAEYNQKTGEVYGLRDGYEVPEGGSVSTFILEHMQRHAPGDVEEMNLTIAQYKDRLKNDLASGLSVELRWFIVELQTPEGLRCRTKYELNMMDGNEITEQSEGFIDDPNVPAHILETYKKRLQVAGIYQFQ